MIIGSHLTSLTLFTFLYNNKRHLGKFSYTWVIWGEICPQDLFESPSCLAYQRISHPWAVHPRKISNEERKVFIWNGTKADLKNMGKVTSQSWNVIFRRYVGWALGKSTEWQFGMWPHYLLWFPGPHFVRSQNDLHVKTWGCLPCKVPHSYDIIRSEGLTCRWIAG